MVVDAQHAGAAEGGVEDGVGAGQRPGVRGGGTSAGLVPAGLDHDDLLGPADAAGGAEELAHVADRLHVQDDAARGRVVGEVVDQVGEIDVEHRADADEAAEADVRLPRPVEDRRCRWRRSG